MKNNRPLMIALDMSRERRESAEAAMAAAARLLRDAEEKLQLLHRYHSDYLGKLRQTGSTSVSSLANSRAFVAKLEMAVTAQAEDVERCRETAGSAKVAWQEASRRVISLEVLIKRREQAEALKGARAEQKQSDEFAARSARQKLVAAC